MTTQDKPAVGPLSAGDLNRAHAAWLLALAKLPDDVEVNMTTEEAQTSLRAALEAVLRPARLAPTAPVEAGGSEEIGDEYEAAAHCVTLDECPPGLFFWNGTLGFKSEYGAMEPVGSNFKTWKVGSRADAYCADSGEYFWGGTSNYEDRAKVLVMPIDAATVAMVASHGPAALRPQPSVAGGSELADAIERVDRWANYAYTYADTIAVDSPLSTFTAGDLRLILDALRPQPSGETLQYLAQAFEDAMEGSHGAWAVSGDEDQAGGETREAVAARIRRLVGLADADFSFVAREAYVSKETDAILALIRPAAPGGGLADLAARVTAEVKRGADGSHVQALGALSNIEAMVRSAIPASEGGEG